jgi:hypothetical protein
MPQILQVIDVDDSFTFADSDTSEQTIISVTPPEDIAFQLGTLNLDVSGLTVNTTFRLKYAIDGTNYRTRYGTGPSGGIIAWTPADGQWLQFSTDGMLVDHPLLLTGQSSTGEPAPVDIPITYGYQA